MKGFILIITAAALAWSPPAYACGVWKMTDLGLKRQVTFYVETVLLSRAKGTRGPRKLIIRIEGRDQQDMHIKVGRRRLITFDNNKLLRRGKPVGAIDGDSVRIGKKTYAISLTYDPKARGVKRWDLKVTRGARALLKGRAMPLCKGASWDPPEEQDDPAHRSLAKKEIRNRVILYLAWRQLIRRR